MERTEEQKKIDSWIAEHINTDALDKNIKIMLSEYPKFKTFDGLEVHNAIEAVYLEITPEEQYDPHIWTVIVERALVMLEPNKDKLFKIEFKDTYVNYVKELTVGYMWIINNLTITLEKACFNLQVNNSLGTMIDFDEDERLPCIITRIK